MRLVNRDSVAAAGAIIGLASLTLGWLTICCPISREVLAHPM
ncbi:MAG: hypothetical protein Q7R57_10430 [Dehalococcoidales bacterium]|nr:hypothetical protein [Dehalococcoidales bacterium]